MAKPASTYHHPTPLGHVRIRLGGGVLAELSWPDRPTPDPDALPAVQAEDRLARAAARQLDEYFAGQRSRFELPLALDGTDFQQAVWTRLADITPGTTTTYGRLAAVLGRPDAARAVGGAVSLNPLVIVLPCHRVVRAGGGLGGFAAGTDRKRWLLAHEGATV